MDLLAPLYDQFLMCSYQTGGWLCRKLFGSVGMYRIHTCIPQCATCSCLSQPACAHFVSLFWGWLLLCLLRNRLVFLQELIFYFSGPQCYRSAWHLVLAVNWCLNKCFRVLTAWDQMWLWFAFSTQNSLNFVLALFLGMGISARGSPELL